MGERGVCQHTGESFFFFFFVEKWTQTKTIKGLFINGLDVDGWIVWGCVQDAWCMVGCSNETSSVLIILKRLGSTMKDIQEH